MAACSAWRRPLVEGALPPAPGSGREPAYERQPDGTARPSLAASSCQASVARSGRRADNCSAIARPAPSWAGGRSAASAQHCPKRSWVGAAFIQQRGEAATLGIPGLRPVPIPKRWRYRAAASGGVPGPQPSPGPGVHRDVAFQSSERGDGHPRAVTPSRHPGRPASGMYLSVLSLGRRWPSPRASPP